MRGPLRVAAIAAAVVALPGCWLQVGAGPEGHSFNPFEGSLIAANAASLTEAWSVSSDPTEAGSVSSDGTEAIVEGGRVFTTDPGAPRVHAIRASDGSPLWTRELALPPGATIEGGLAMVDGEVYGAWRTMSGTDCRAGHVRLDPTDGSVVALTDTTPTAWDTAVPTGDKIVQKSWPVPTGGVGCQAEPGSGSVRLVVRDQASGEVLWQSAESLGRSLPVTGAGRVYVRAGQRFLAYDLEGCGAPTCPPLWNVEPILEVPGAGTFPFQNPYGPPMYVDGTLFTSWASTFGLAALDAASGELLWVNLPQHSLEAGGGGLAAADGLVYLAGQGGLAMFDADGCGTLLCDPVHSAALPTYYQSGSGGTLAVAGGVVYASVANVEGEQPYRPNMIHAIDTASCAGGPCRLLWTELLYEVANLSVSDGRLLAATGAGLVAFAPAASP